MTIKTLRTFGFLLSVLILATATSAGAADQSFEKSRAKTDIQGTSVLEAEISGFIADSSSLELNQIALQFPPLNPFSSLRLTWGPILLDKFQVIDMEQRLPKSVAEQVAIQLSALLGVHVHTQSNYSSLTRQSPMIASVSSTQLNPDWGLDRIDQRNLPLDNTYLNASSGAGVTAYVVDTGIRSTHNDFGGRVLTGFSAIADGNGTEDCDGHGTHVAGTIGGELYGVAKAVELVPVRVLDCTGSGTEADVIQGIQWAIAHHVSGPAVMNLSLGGSYSALLNEAVRLAFQDGIVVVTASGNEASDACSFSPASEPTAITVNASVIDDGDFYWSNYGSCTDIYAPGSEIRSSYIGSDTATATLSGTSMAAPHVAGAAAAVLSSNPELSPAQVWVELQRQATHIDWFVSPSDAKLLLYTGSANNSFSSTPTPTVGGTSSVNSTLNADVGDWSSTCDCSPVFKYRWLRDGFPIAGATSTNYRISADDLGSRLSFLVIASAEDFQDVSKQSAVTAVVQSGFSISSEPVISGTLTSGQTLKINTGSWSPKPRFSYQWNCDGRPISRATKSSLKLTSSQNGCQISATITATARNVATTVFTTAEVGPVGTQFSKAPMPEISGSLGFGGTLSANLGTWSPTPTTIDFQWYFGDGTPVPDATGSELVITESDYGRGFYVCVTASRLGYVETSRCSETTEIVTGYPLVNTPKPQIDGTAGIGNTLTAVPGDWDDGVLLNYQWLRNGNVISGASSSTYDITSSDSGSYLSLSVTGSKDGYTGVTLISDPLGPVAKNFSRYSVPVITGRFAPGKTIKVSTGTWSPRPKFTYQWNCDGLAISKATKSSLKISSSLSGCEVTVTITATARGYAQMQLTSDPVGP